MRKKLVEHLYFTEEMYAVQVILQCRLFEIAFLQIEGFDCIKGVA